MMYSNDITFPPHLVYALDHHHAWRSTSFRRLVDMLLLGEQLTCDELHPSGKGAAGFADELQRTAERSMNSSSYFN